MQCQNDVLFSNDGDILERQRDYFKDYSSLVSSHFYIPSDMQEMYLREENAIIAPYVSLTVTKRKIGKLQDLHTMCALWKCTHLRLVFRIDLVIESARLNCNIPQLSGNILSKWSSASLDCALLLADFCSQIGCRHQCLSAFIYICATQTAQSGAQPALHFGGGNFHEISFDDVIVLIRPWYNFFTNVHI